MIADNDFDHWMALIGKLWAPDTKTIVDFLPEIVAVIKSTKSATVAEAGLFTVLFSPKVRNHSRIVKLLTPSMRHPGIPCNQIVR
jgi:hypothetical protein